MITDRLAALKVRDNLCAWAEARALDVEENPLTGAGAIFDMAHQYRYLLWRRWSDTAPMLGFCMLNPSKADAGSEDATSTRCNNRAISLGFGGVLICNLFAYRATDPVDMKTRADPVGRHNDAALEMAFASTRTMIAAWGTHGEHRGRFHDVLARAQELGRSFHHLGLTKDGHPRHPLYVAADMHPVRWDVAGDVGGEAQAA